MDGLALRAQNVMSRKSQILHWREAGEAKMKQKQKIKKKKKKKKRRINKK